MPQTSFTVPKLNEASGDLGVKQLLPGTYLFRLVEIEDKSTEKHLSKGQMSLNCKFICEDVLEGDLDAKEKKDAKGKPYFHRIFLLEESHEYQEIGRNELKNMLNALGVKVDKTGNFKIPQGKALKAAGKVRIKQDKAYEKDGELFTPDPYARVVEWLAIEEE